MHYVLYLYARSKYVDFSPAPSEKTCLTAFVLAVIVCISSSVLDPEDTASKATVFDEEHSPFILTCRHWKQVIMKYWLRMLTALLWLHPPRVVLKRQA